MKKSIPIGSILRLVGALVAGALAGGGGVLATRPCPACPACPEVLVAPVAAPVAPVATAPVVEVK